MTLGCLAPYRRLGIGNFYLIKVDILIFNLTIRFREGSVMLNHVLNYCEKDENFESVYL